MRSRLQWIALALALLLVVGTFLYFRAGICGAWYPRSFAVALADVDGDGDLDAFMANGHTDDTGSKNAVWLNDGRGRFVDGGQRLGTSGSMAVALGDVDGDGDVDAFVGNSSSVVDAGGTVRHNEPNQVWLTESMTPVPTATPVLPTSTPEPSGCTSPNAFPTEGAELVWPRLLKTQPAQAASGDENRVIAVGGYLYWDNECGTLWLEPARAFIAGIRRRAVEGPPRNTIQHKVDARRIARGVDLHLRS